MSLTGSKEAALSDWPLRVVCRLSELYALTGSSWADTGLSVSIDCFYPRSGQSIDQEVDLVTDSERLIPVIGTNLNYSAGLPLLTSDAISRSPHPSGIWIS